MGLKAATTANRDAAAQLTQAKSTFGVASTAKQEADDKVYYAKAKVSDQRAALSTALQQKSSNAKTADEAREKSTSIARAKGRLANLRSKEAAQKQIASTEAARANGLKGQVKAAVAARKEATKQVNNQAGEVATADEALAAARKAARKANIQLAAADSSRVTAVAERRSALESAQAALARAKADATRAVQEAQVEARSAGTQAQNRNMKAGAVLHAAEAVSHTTEIGSPWHRRGLAMLSMRSMQHKPKCRGSSPPTEV